MKNASIALLVLALAGVAQAQQQAALHAADAGSRDFFGQSVSISGATILVGSSRDNITSSNQGSAYVFVASGSSWSQQAKCIPGDPQANALFGASVCLSGDTASVGSPQAFLTTQGASQGAAYVFVRSGSTWTQQAKLTASDAAVADLFGFSIAIDGDTIAVGAPYRDDLGSDSGAVYVFVRSGTAWSQQAKLHAGDGASADQFGASLSLQGDTLAVGAPKDDGSSTDEGSAYVFVRSGSIWTQQAKLVASDPAANDGFARSASLSGEKLVLGASQKDQVGIDSGCAYLFARNGSVWTQQTKLVASDAGSFDAFGRAVAMVSGTILVGACQDNVTGTSSGSVYVFVGNGASWLQAGKLTPTVSAAGDFFGSSVSLSGTSAAIGGPSSDDVGLNAGSAYAFSVTPPGAPFCAGDGTLATACPCANTGGAGRGCDNSIQTGGALLTSSGAASLASDSVHLESSGELATALSIFLQGTTNLGSAAVFGDGVRCVGGALKRIGVHNASGGTVSYPLPGDPSISARSAALGDAIGAGQARYYQTYYRDPNLAFCPSPPGNSWNVSSGQVITWWP
jgi:hypothetical protein